MNVKNILPPVAPIARGGGKAARIVLASQSAIRSTLLSNAGVSHLCVASDVDEGAMKSAGKNAPGDLGGDDLALMLAEAKAGRVGKIHFEDYVIGADQILSCEGEIFDKPLNRERARRQLRHLQGRHHELISAAVICYQGKIIWRHVGRARLSMRELSPSALDLYLDHAGEDVYRSVGSYHLEGLGVRLFDRIDGDYFTVLGLPLLAVLSFLRTRGILEL
ncbi:Maf family protein [Varunaivibrio sulfuroxidans]|uniref:Nucleoside triphosphate pyrophosphatase n=1 Tax=Varunaivibrio sulfuroxidans TaxID=1773489 RepID=A0A4R3JHX4_9PROT|nr:nucleoside triphosphate pyrophosphatase [Varunaivibrio sulfuroxidans]TCS64866.1 septum formation protein [Varunaivibrio sulfuroxidans]WES29837.1 Maf family protein [Varunaivibrio sulfuroxidans]